MYIVCVCVCVYLCELSNKSKLRKTVLDLNEVPIIIRAVHRYNASEI